MVTYPPVPLPLNIREEGRKERGGLRPSQKLLWLRERYERIRLDKIGGVSPFVKGDERDLNKESRKRGGGLYSLWGIIGDREI